MDLLYIYIQSFIIFSQTVFVKVCLVAFLSLALYFSHQENNSMLLDYSIKLFASFLLFSFIGKSSFIMSGFLLCNMYIFMAFLWTLVFLLFENWLQLIIIITNGNEFSLFKLRRLVSDHTKNIDIYFLILA